MNYIDRQYKYADGDAEFVKCLAESGFSGTVDWESIEEWLWEKHKFWFRVNNSFGVNNNFYCEGYISAESGGLPKMIETAHFNSPIVARKAGIKKAIKFLTKHNKP